MRLVFDTNVLVYAFVTPEFVAKARRDSNLGFPYHLIFFQQLWQNSPFWPTSDAPQ